MKIKEATTKHEELAFLVGFNVFTATGWYLEKQHHASAAPVLATPAVTAPIAAPTPLTPIAPPAAPVATPANAAPTEPPKDLPPLPSEYKIVNGHDHLYRIVDFEKYLPAAEALGVTKTLFVASSNFTIMGKKGNKEEGNDINSKEILDCAKKYPDKVIPFITFTPATPDKVKLLEDYVAQGAKGIKLYTGHNEFHDRTLDDPDMYPVYEWCEKNQFPILWHVNMNSYKDEFLKVMVKYPKLRVCLPHFGVGFFDSQGKLLDQLGEVMDTYPNVYTDTSFGTLAQWAWDFGDGATSAEQNPLHTFSTAGDYTVTLTATGANGHSSSTNQVISVVANYHFSSGTYSWVDPSGMTALSVPQNGVSAAQPLPFTFTFYGQPYSTVYVAANGMLGFNPTSLGIASNTDIPNAGIPNNFIAPFWDALNPLAGSAIRVGTVGAAPNRRYVVSWVGISTTGTRVTTVTFQALLFEGSNEILFQYLDVAPASRSASAAA